MKNICIIGTGYVGLVTGACLAEIGNRVVCVDTDAQKIATLREGGVPFYEPDLADLVARNVTIGRLSFSTSLAQGMHDAAIVFIAVGTPRGERGESDLQHVRAAAGEIARNVRRDILVVNKSTVPVETSDLVAAILREAAPSEHHVSVASNPEFLRVGCAVADFMRPERIVIGVHEVSTANILIELYAPLNAQVIVTDVRTSEMIKYTANAFLATKISFANEIANICDAVGVDVTEVMHAVGADTRIGRAFLQAGLGFGGSCLPKDVQALAHISRAHSVTPRMLEATLETNRRQIDRICERISVLCGGLKGKKVAVLGLAFKPDTDDVRESPALALAARLVQSGASVTAHDPIAVPNTQKHSPPGIGYAPDPYTALDGAEAVVVATDWNEYKHLDLTAVAARMKGDLFVDARNLYSPQSVRDAGLRYEGVGRPAKRPTAKRVTV